MTQKFELGSVMMTSDATILDSLSVFTALLRHSTGDWGEVGEEDGKANNLALKRCESLFSEYKDINGVRFRIITELDRSYTTILLAEEY